MAGPRRKNSNNVRTPQASLTLRSISQPVIAYISTFVVVALLLAIVLAMAEFGLSGNRVAITAAPAFVSNPGATVHISSSTQTASLVVGISPMLFDLPPWCGAPAPTFTSSTTTIAPITGPPPPPTVLPACKYDIQTTCDPGCGFTNFHSAPGILSCGTYATIQCTCASGYTFAQWWTTYTGPGEANDCSWSTNPLGDKLGTTDFLECSDSGDYITAACSCIIPYSPQSSSTTEYSSTSTKQSTTTHQSTTPRTTSTTICYTC